MAARHAKIDGLLPPGRTFGSREHQTLSRLGAEGHGTVALPRIVAAHEPGTFTLEEVHHPELQKDPKRL